VPKEPARAVCPWRVRSAMRPKRAARQQQRRQTNVKDVRSPHRRNRKTVFRKCVSNVRPYDFIVVGKRSATQAGRQESTGRCCWQQLKYPDSCWRTVRIAEGVMRADRRCRCAGRDMTAEARPGTEPEMPNRDGAASPAPARGSNRRYGAASGTTLRATARRVTAKRHPSVIITSGGTAPLPSARSR